MFDEASYSIREGASLNVIVNVTAEGILFDREVEITVMTINETATGTVILSLYYTCMVSTISQFSSSRLHPTVIYLPCQW